MSDRRVAAVVLDVDGTLLDSAPGIVAGFRHALVTVGIEPPTDEVLAADIGPPMPLMLAALGVPADRIDDGIAAYRSFYRREGLQRSTPYAGVRAMLDRLSGGGVRLGTATAKRTDTARAILEHHGLAAAFDVVNGSTDTRPDKADTLVETLRLLDVAAGPDCWMVGDRRSDIVAGAACGVTTVAVGWGYGSEAELVDAGADHLVRSPAELAALILG